ncbi:hypothetical protein AJ78_05293 [Emergomyces pasteurianus Ep9510]|uniref:Uncharacterized protein n=1 Tax=Emergomyces pasteurianus Ep9510 TaxID=1447872 RepID=A0A1J9PEA7_9EURO|nr:hypothetical protein AJ78_05293 [Emergomyces pasteurianus Ep9510]
MDKDYRIRYRSEDLKNLNWNKHWMSYIQEVAKGLNRNADLGTFDTAHTPATEEVLGGFMEKLEIGDETSKLLNLYGIVNTALICICEDCAYGCLGSRKVDGPLSERLSILDKRTSLIMENLYEA